MSEYKQTALGFINGWAKKSLGELLDEYQIDDGLAISGTVNVTVEQAERLIEYLSTANCTEYGFKMDFALFYKSEKNVKFSGTIKLPYNKDETTSAKPVTPTRAKRQV